MPPKGTVTDLNTQYLPQDRLAGYRFAHAAAPVGGDSAWNTLPAALHSKEVLQAALTKAINKVIILITQ